MVGFIQPGLLRLPLHELHPNTQETEPLVCGCVHCTHFSCRACAQVQVTQQARLWRGQVGFKIQGTGKMCGTVRRAAGARPYATPPTHAGRGPVSGMALICGAFCLNGAKKRKGGWTVHCPIKCNERMGWVALIKIKLSIHRRDI